MSYKINEDIKTSVENLTKYKYLIQSFFFFKNSLKKFNSVKIFNESAYITHEFFSTVENEAK